MLTTCNGDLTQLAFSHRAKEYAWLTAKSKGKVPDDVEGDLELDDGTQNLFEGDADAIPSVVQSGSGKAAKLITIAK
jgi:hypothetical protein